MNWVIDLSASAQKDLRSIPVNKQRPLIKAINSMETDPLLGDVKPLKGSAWKGRFRKRVGSYRIIFTIDHQTKVIAISRIVIRSEKTYR